MVLEAVRSVETRSGTVGFSSRASKPSAKHQRADMYHQKVGVG